MATSLVPSHTFVVRASSVSDNTRRKTTSGTGGGGGGKWWAPLFGWSAEADYIESSSSEESNQVKSENNNATKTSKFSRGCFTEEKAKQLRMMTKESFHDAMYHSAIASRLASDFSDHPHN